MAICQRITTAFGAAASFALCGAAYAKDGQPVPWQIDFQPAASPIMEQIHSFNTYVTIIITLITIRSRPAPRTIPCSRLPGP